MVWAAGAGLAALLVYVLTLAPGMVAITDTPAFQFVGRVLGTVHNPGYPGYVMVTHVWSYLPIGSLAYRINLFSAVAAALTVSGMFLLCRAIGVRPWIAMAAVLGFAFGRTFWSQSVIAEVYTLNSALVVWALLMLVKWGETGRLSCYFTATALLAFGLGNHTTILLFIPGAALYVVLCRPRNFLRPRMVVATLLILAIGALQYGFILWRSQHPGAYLESQAFNLGDLLRVVRGAQFEQALFSFSPREVFSQRLPLVLVEIILRDMTAPALLLAVAGGILLLFNRTRTALLLLSGGGAILLFAINYDAADLAVFTIPLLLVLWLCAAFAAQVTLDFVRGRTVQWLLGCLVCLAPVWQFSRNLEACDMHRETLADRQMTAVLTSLPDRALLLREDFLVDRMVMYKLLGEDAGHRRRIELEYANPVDIEDRLKAGWRVFTFAKTARQLRLEGLDVSFGAAPLPTEPLEAVLNGVKDGALLALAVPGIHTSSFLEAHRELMQAIDEQALRAGRDQSAFAAAGPLRTNVNPETRATTRGRVEVNLSTDRPPILGWRHRFAVHAAADALTASAGVDGRDIVASGAGAVMSLWDRDGALITASELRAEDGFRPLVDAGPLSIYEIRGRLSEQIIRDEWTTLDSTTGLLLLKALPATRLTIRCSAAVPCALNLSDRSESAAQVDGRTLHERGGHQRQEMVIAVPDNAAPASFLLALAGQPDVTARADGQPASAFLVSTTGMLDVPGRRDEQVVMARWFQAVLLGPGWSEVDGDGAGPFRWLTGSEAHVLLPTARDGDVTLRLQARFDGDDAAWLEPVLNGRSLGSKPLRVGWQYYEWPLEAAALHRGQHVLVIRSEIASGSRERRRGLAVSRIELVRP